MATFDNTTLWPNLLVSHPETYKVTFFPFLAPVLAPVSLPQRAPVASGAIAAFPLFLAPPARSLRG